MDVKENEIEEFYVNPIKEKSYELASHISPNGVIDENIANIIYDEMKKIIVDII